MMNLIQETRENNDNHMWDTFVRLMGIVALILMIVFSIISAGGIFSLVSFLDYPTLFVIVGIILLMLLSTKTTKAFFRAFRLFLKINDSTPVPEVEQSLLAVKLVIITAIAAGAMVTVVSFNTLLYNMSDPSSLGPNAAAACLSIFYSTTITLFLIPVAMKLKLWLKAQ